MVGPVKTILIADDEEDLRLLVQVTLEHPSYRILTAIDGCAAMEAVCTHIPDLLILDWMMPGLNGCEVVRKLRLYSDTAKIPIVMLTAKDGLDARKQIASLDLAGYLVKPFSPLELIHKVREVLA
ncbi:response regulator transcription factor [Candidatus Nitrospira allomarina]|uniref:Response regulator n=1 Tax=Candidatus Nitrospira allomarina TaxID=3020900 RepID=A0AA96JS25_9BACT|nr:response regulator [Candidatus Nitrospira allomarina]WNM57763.1 response regulator [Candidatus Nitrospira allomarina]